MGPEKPQDNADGCFQGRAVIIMASANSLVNRAPTDKKKAKITRLKTVPCTGPENLLCDNFNNGFFQGYFGFKIIDILRG